MVHAEPPAIVVAGLTKRYGAVQAVDELSFVVPAGSSTALLGANGAGKTTTIAMLLGLLAPSAGRITVLGEDMHAPPLPRARAGSTSPRPTSTCRCASRCARTCASTPTSTASPSADGADRASSPPTSTS